jgi:transposase
MYSIDIIKASILLYYKLKNNKIIGKKRVAIINHTFNLHMNTLYNWIKLYYNKINNTFDFSSYKTNFKYNNLKITNNIEIFIINSIDSNNNFNIKKIKNNIKLNFNVSISKSSIYHILHKNKLTYKKNYIKNDPYNSEQNNKFKDDLKNKISNIDINNILSYDEMSIYLNQKPYKGWSKKGNNCFIKTNNKTIFNKRYSIGMSISINGKIDFTIVEGALKSYKFNKFMKKIMTCKNIIFMDNASIHKNSLFKNFIINNNFNVIYNIPYKSELNPIEYIFSLLRKELLNNDNSTYELIIKTIINFIKNFNKKYSYNIFNKCFNILLE